MGQVFRELETSPPVDACQNASQLRQQQRGQDALTCKRFLIRLQALLTRQVYYIDQTNSKKVLGTCRPIINFGYDIPTLPLPPPLHRTSGFLVL